MSVLTQFVAQLVGGSLGLFFGWLFFIHVPYRRECRRRRRQEET